MFLTGLFTSLLPIDTVFTQLSTYRQQRHSLFDVRSEGNFFTDLSIKVIGPYLFDVCWYKEYVSVEYRHPISYACCQYLTCLSAKLEQIRHWEMHDNWGDRQVGIVIRTFLKRQVFWYNTQCHLNYYWCFGWACCLCHQDLSGPRR